MRQSYKICGEPANLVDPSNAIVMMAATLPALIALRICFASYKMLCAPAAGPVLLGSTSET